MPKKCNHYEYIDSTLEWVVGWDVETEELTCTVCGKVFDTRKRGDKI